ncbi:hypothetical protein FB451DRAFT_1040083, partial [Mycena latifolia]
LLSYLLQWGLFGALSVQLYLYYQAFPKDRLPTKCLVYSVYTIELVATIMITHDAFETFGYGFGNVSTPSKITLGWLDIPIMGGLVAFMGQSFYAYRLYVLSESRLVPMLIVVVSLHSHHFGGGWGTYVALVYDLHSFMSQVWNGASALSDTIIAVWMTYYLSRQVTVFRQTRALVSKLIRLILETGSLTALVATTNLVLFFAFPGRMYYLASTGPMPRFYANCILVILNARCQIVGGRGDDVSPTDLLPSNPSFLCNLGTHAASANDTHLVKINREVLSDEALNNPLEMKGMDVCPFSHE